MANKSRKYYEAYDDRYLQVHKKGLQWSHDEPTPIVSEAIKLLGLNKNSQMLEIGCGEGRDAIPLLSKGYDLTATDISHEAIGFCRRKCPDFSDSFSVLDCISGKTDKCYDFIYAVAVLHMLVDDADRTAFYGFIRTHLSDSGSALICTMGNGNTELKSDTATAFELRERVHDESGKVINIANTSCRMVNFDNFKHELTENGFEILYIGSDKPFADFSQMMYAIVK